MNDFKEKYINPFTDYGFKRLFGEEPNKDLLLDFLNELLKEKEGTITHLSYLPNEKLPITLGDRRAIFDIYCTNEKGEQFIVEMQKAEQKTLCFHETVPGTYPAGIHEGLYSYQGYVRRLVHAAGIAAINPLAGSGP